MSVSATRTNSTLTSLFSLTGKTAIVTGAASGIGKATAQLFCEVGARVVIADINGDGADQAAHGIVAGGGEALGVRVDIADEASVNAMLRTAVAAFGGVDVLVNNAAYRRKGAFLTLTVEEWDSMHAIIARGTFLCMRDTIRQMRCQGRGGAIVNISTIGAAHPTIFNNVHYDSAKSGVNALTRNCAIEFAADGIRVNAVMPGGVDTEGMRQMRLSADSGYVSAGPMTLTGRMPLGLAQPMQLASVILFLASPASSYMTGHVMAVDGGYLVS